MPQSTSEVLVGAGTLYTAPVGTAYPANPDTAPSGTWVEVGYSEEGWTIAVDRNWEEIFAAEVLNPILILKSMDSIRVRGTVMQASLENLKLALAGGTITTNAGPPATKTYAWASETALPEEKAVLLRTVAPQVSGAYEVRDWKIYRVVAMGAVELAYNKAPNVTTIGMDFRALKPTSGNIVDIVETTS